MDMYSGHVSLRLISKWMKDRAKIMKAAAGKYNKMFKIRPAKKYIRLYSELMCLIQQETKAGVWILTGFGQRHVKLIERCERRIELLENT